LNIKPCMGQISGTWELLLCEYWRKSGIIGEKNTDLKRPTGRLKLHFLTEIGWFHWNQGEEVAHFAWFGEFLSTLPHIPLPFTKQMCCTMIFKRMQLTCLELNTEHGSSFYVNIKEEVRLLEKKRLTGWLKLRFLAGIGRFHWNFAWLGEPW
jgi:hypothetical protein